MAKAVISLVILAAVIAIAVIVFGGSSNCPPDTYCPSPGGGTIQNDSPHYDQPDPDHDPGIIIR